MVNYIDVDDDDDSDDSDDGEGLNYDVPSEVMEEDDPDPAVTAAIERDIKFILTEQPGTAKGLTSHAVDEARPTVFGQHIWGGVREALENTFPNWPECQDYFTFCSVVAQAMVRRKNNPQGPSADNFVQELFNKNPQVHADFTTFMRGSLFGKTYDPRSPAKGTHLGILKLMVRGVKYLNAEERAKYEVTLGPILMRRGEVFDTSALYNKKKQTAVPGSFGGRSTYTEKNKRCIWVLSPDGKTFYSHFGKLGGFHHSSFMGGGNVMAAGEWYVDNGKLTLINACSGHYQPEAWRFQAAVKALIVEGVINADTEIQVWEREGGAEHRTSAIAFMNFFAANLSKYQMFPLQA